MIVEVRAAPPFYKNGFLLACERTREAAIVDPGDEVDELLAAARDYDADVRCILLTHAHVDHVTGVAAAKAAFDVPVYLHRDDLFLYERAVEQGAMFGFRVSPPPPIDVFYDGSPIAVGDYEVRVHHTPGHCPGGVCLQAGKKDAAGRDLFVGDTLFAGSIGRTDLPGGDYAVLMQSITEVLFPLGDDCRVYPGHGPDTTIGRERTRHDAAAALRHNSDAALRHNSGAALRHHVDVAQPFRAAITPHPSTRSAPSGRPGSGLPGRPAPA